MSEDTRVLLQRWFDEVWNQNREGAMDELMAPDAIAHGFPVPGTSSSAEAFKQAVRQFHKTFSKIHISIEDLLIEGEKAAVRWHASMKHTGDGLGFGATGETVHVNGISIIHVKGGKIAEGWDALDLTRHVHALGQIAAKQQRSA